MSETKGEILRWSAEKFVAMEDQIDNLLDERDKLKAELDQLKWAVKVNNDEGKQYEESLRKRAEKAEADNARLSNLLKMAELTLKKIAAAYEQAKGEGRGK